MRIELAQMALVDGDLAHNTRKVLAAIERADIAAGTSLVMFPEAALSGFPTRENVARVAQSIDGPVLGEVRDAARRRGVSVALGFSERDGTRFFNTSVLIDASGEIVLRHRKVQLFGSDHEVFTPGDRFATCRWNGVRVGILICFDIEFPEPARALASLGAELLLVTNGNMDPYGPLHRRAIAARAMENQLHAVLVNRCGTGARGLHFPGESASADPWGELSFLAGEEEAVYRVAIDRAQVPASRKDFDYLRERRVALSLRPQVEVGGEQVLLVGSRAAGDPE